MASEIIWRSVVRPGKREDAEGNIRIEWRIYKGKPGFFLCTDELGKEDSERELAMYLAEENGFQSYNGNIFKLEVKENISIKEFREIIERMFKTMEKFHQQKKSLEPISVRIPEWINEEVKRIKGEDMKMSEVIRDALVLWAKNQKN